jgi:hypothetical protein
VQDLHNTQSTIGIECKDIKLAGGEVSVWDFAGQLEYTSTHQFFLSIEVLLYFIVFNLQSLHPLHLPSFPPTPPLSPPLPPLLTFLFLLVIVIYFGLIDGGLSAVL